MFSTLIKSLEKVLVLSCWQKSDQSSWIGSCSQNLDQISWIDSYPNCDQSSGQSVVQSFWKSPVLSSDQDLELISVLNCFQNLLIWLESVLIKSSIVYFCSQFFKKISVLNCFQNLLKWLQFKILKRLSWISSHPNCDQKVL